MNICIDGTSMTLAEAKAEIERREKEEAEKWVTLNQYTRWNPETGEFLAHYSTPPNWRPQLPGPDDKSHADCWSRGLSTGQAQAKELADLVFGCLSNGIGGAPGSFTEKGRQDALSLAAKIRGIS